MRLSPVALRGHAADLIGLFQGAWMQKQRDQRAVRRKPLPNSPGERQRLARSAAAREGDEPLE